MKVIFLDIDGVLNVIGQGHDKYGQIFHNHFVENLARVIKATDAKIVISSTWRHSGLDEMLSMWKDRNLPGEVIGITPTAQVLVYLGLFDNVDEIVRGNEIQFWLDKTQVVTQYVILDDDEDMLESQLPFFVRTSGNEHHTDYIDVGYGLTIECADKAIEILNK